MSPWDESLSDDARLKKNKVLCYLLFFFYFMLHKYISKSVLVLYFKKSKNMRLWSQKWDRI